MATAPTALARVTRPDNADLAATEILEAVNASPRTPTVASIATILRKYASRAAAPSPLVSDPLIWFKVPETLTESLSPEMRRLREHQRTSRLRSRGKRTDDEIDADEIVAKELASAIIARPVATFRDVIEKALVVEEYELGWLRDGRYIEAENGSIGSRALMALVEGVLAFQVNSEPSDEDAFGPSGPSPRSAHPILLSARGREYVAAQLDVEAAEEAQDEEAIEAASKKLRSVEVAIITKTATDWSDVVDKAHVANSRPGISCAIALGSVVQAVLEMGRLADVE